MRAASLFNCFLPLNSYPVRQIEGILPGILSIFGESQKTTELWNPITFKVGNLYVPILTQFINVVVLSDSSLESKGFVSNIN